MPDGSLETGMPAEAKDLAMTSFSAWYGAKSGPERACKQKHADPRRLPPHRRGRSEEHRCRDPIIIIIIIIIHYA